MFGRFLMVWLVLAGMAALASPPAQDARAMIAEVVRTGSVIVPGIEFERAAESPSSGSRAALQEVRAMLAAHVEWTFEVQVHTDETGDPARDAGLSTARARSVVAWLTREGIAATRLVPRGYGSSRPLTGASVDGRLQHGRVELRKLNEE